MCKILKNIQGKTAEEILKEYGQDSSIPVNLNQLLLNMGVSALPYDFTVAEENSGLQRGDILGLVMSKGDNVAILYKKDDTLNRQRFTIAHEIAHCCLSTHEFENLHIEFRMNEQEKTAHEIEADIFAGKLLIPLEKLQEVYLNLVVPSSTALARKFGVSVNVMEARLDYLKISYYNNKGQAIVYGDE